MSKIRATNKTQKPKIRWMMVFGFLFLILFLAVASSKTAEPASALSDRVYNLYSQNSIYFYNPNQHCIMVGGSDGGSGEGAMLSGNSRVEKIWNYIVELGISGLSNNPAAIAGVVGNMSVETGGTFNPFVQNSFGCTGIVQWCKGSWNDGFFSYMKNNGYDKYYYKGAQPSIDESIVDDGIKAQLDFLFKNGTGGVTAKNFIANLSVPNNQSGVSGARAYSDLFLVTVENAYGGGETLEDAGVKRIAGYSTYQAASSRRSRAETLYNLYGDGGGSSESSGSSDSGDSSGSSSGVKRISCVDSDAEGLDEDDSDDSESPQAGDLISYIKSWVWPTYHSPPFMDRKSAYADYMDHNTSYHPCNGVDCGAFVSNIIRASGWDPSYPLAPTGTQQSWLAENWNKVSVGSLKLGDVGIRTGHVILYIGNISGFSSKTASASSCDGVHRRAPTAGSPNENLNNYTWYRKR